MTASSRAGASASRVRPWREAETRISRPLNSITASLSVGESITVSITRTDLVPPLVPEPAPAALRRV